MNLTCVRCTSVLDKNRFSDVEVDLCPSCGGLWLDHGEIERIGRGQPDEMQRLTTALTGRPDPESPSETQSHCPACPGALKEVVLGPVRVDYCTKCHGVFLDRGELEQAVKAVDGSTLKQVLALAGSIAG